MAHPSLKDDPFPEESDFERERLWFARRLNGRTLPEVQLLFGRAAMRSLPHLFGLLHLHRKKDGFWTPEAHLVTVLRSYPTSAGAALVSPADAARFRSAAAAATARANFGERATAAATARATYAARVAARTAATDAAVTDAAVTVTEAAAVAAISYPGAADASNVNSAIAAAVLEQDCRTLNRDGVGQLAREPLWPRPDFEVLEAFGGRFDTKTYVNGIPSEFHPTWRKMSNALRDLPDDFAVWTEWYQGMLDGEQNGRYLFGLPTERALRLNVDIALIDDELWKDPAKANAEIRRLVEVARREVGAEVPAQKPAALEPLFVDGRLILPGGPLAHDSKPDNLVGALKALRLDFNELASDCDGVANISEADVKSLGWVARRIPESEPISLELHRVAHLEKALESFGGKVSEQWPDFLAARYYALSLQFGSVMNQFPNWRDFKRVANSGKLSAEQVQEAQKVVALANDILRPFPEAISADIPDQLQDLAKPLFTVDEAPAFDPIAAGMDLLAEDVLESFNNVLKRIAQGALAFKFGAEKIAGKGWTRFVKGIEKGVEEAAEKAGKRFGKALVATLVGAPFATGFGWLVATFPDKFGWLKRIVDLLT
jgi:hypothetical protein